MPTLYSLGKAFLFKSLAGVALRTTVYLQFTLDLGSQMQMIQLKHSFWMVLV